MVYLLAVSSIDWEAVGHWSMLAQGLFAFLTFLATLVYVGFTYHIMKWAVGQGKASVALAQNALTKGRSQRFSNLRRLDAILTGIPRITSQDEFRPSLVG